MADREYITRQEFSARHDDLVTRVAKIEGLVEAQRDTVSLLCWLP
jgi:hypothetical protein